MDRSQSPEHSSRGMTRLVPPLRGRYRTRRSQPYVHVPGLGHGGESSYMMYKTASPIKGALRRCSYIAHGLSGEQNCVTHTGSLAQH